MPDSFNDNTCITVPFIDIECAENHDLRPGGADGSASDGDDEGGIYGGQDGSEPITLAQLNYMRNLPCGPLDMKALRTLFYHGFRISDELCERLRIVEDCLDGIKNYACVPANFRQSGVVADTYGRTDFNFSALSATSVQSAGGPLGLVVSATGGSVQVLPETQNRYRLGAAGTSRVTMTFAQPICDLTLNFQDIDAPLELVDNFSKAPDLITPPFTNNTLSDVIITDINSNTLSFDYSNTGGFSTVVFINTVTTCTPCVPGQICTNSLGDTQFRDTNGDPLVGQFEIC